MQMNLFNYTTLSTRLEKNTRTLFVTLNRPDWNNAFKLEMLFELESLFAWCTSKVEINSIFIDSSTHKFSSGIEFNQLSHLSAAQLEKITTKLHKIIFSMLQLPQTIVMDLGQGTDTLATEFALGADIRLAEENTTIKFDHALYGLVPAAGGMSMLSTLISPSFARQWLMSGTPISQSALEQSGFLHKFYQNTNKQQIISEILTGIAAKAPVQRIQTKLGLFESVRNQLEAGITIDRKIAKASMITEDWKARNSDSENVEFMPAKSMSYSVKLSLIKNENGPTPEH